MAVWLCYSLGSARSVRARARARVRTTNNSACTCRYNPRGSAWSADFFDPDEFTRYPDMDMMRLSMLEPPNSRYRGRNMAAALQDLPPDVTDGAPMHPSRSAAVHVPRL